MDIPHKLQKLGVPGDAILALRNPRETKCLDAARRFDAAPKDLIRTLVMAGHHGCGKSTAAAHVLSLWARRWDWDSQASGGKRSVPAVWMRAAEVTSATEFGRVDPEWLEGCERAQILVVDDLGKDATTAGLVALGNLLSLRHERRSRTVVTSNLSLPEFEARYGQSWFERMRSAAIIPDLRGEKSIRERGRP